MRLQEGAHLLRGGLAAIDQFQEHGMHDVAVPGELWRNAHLLQQRVRNTLAGLGPDLQELLKLVADSRILARESEPENRFRVIDGKNLVTGRSRCIGLGKQYFRKSGSQRVKAVPLCNKSWAQHQFLQGG